jgi:23S rRNA (uracil1939-C5)-methyltransferase
MVTSVEVESIAAGGDGVARAEGLVIFLPRTAPGDAGRARVSVKGRFGRGEMEVLDRPAAVRVEPPCEHYTRDRCGGCQLQHMSYESQLAAKGRIIADSITRIGRREVSAPTVEPSPDQWRYRRKLTLALRRRGDRWIAGLHPYDDPAGVFDLRDCPITAEPVVGAWKDVMRASKLLPDAKELRGSLLMVDGRFSLALEGGVTWPEAERFFEAVPVLDSLWWTREGGSRRLMADRAPTSSASASFAQVNAGVAGLLHERVVARVTEFRPATVIDAYAGSGETAVMLASGGARITAIELDRAASRRCEALLPAGSAAIAGKVEDHLAASLPADVVILNPPRTGVDERVTTVLRATNPGPRAIVYVSCNPATLARDIARLPGWRIQSLDAFDMFPQTAHVETLCVLVPEAA